MILTFDLEGQGHICLPWFIMSVYISKSASNNQYARYIYIRSRSQFVSHVLAYVLVHVCQNQLNMTSCLRDTLVHMILNLGLEGQCHTLF